MSDLNVFTCTISNGQTVSTAIDCYGARAARISMPAAFTGATLGVQVRAPDGTYQTLYDKNGVAYSITCAAGRDIQLPLADFLGIDNFKLVSGAAEGGDRVISVWLV